jgi:lipopolysaccharide/colanic/teichoic acid biosynthesis glycosyltransferase
MSPLEERLKRLLDVVGATAGLVLTAPALGLAALAVRREDGGPALFRQERVGRHGGRSRSSSCAP